MCNVKRATDSSWTPVLDTHLYAGVLQVFEVGDDPIVINLMTVWLNIDSADLSDNLNTGRVRFRIEGVISALKVFDFLRFCQDKLIDFFITECNSSIRQEYCPCFPS